MGSSRVVETNYMELAVDQTSVDSLENVNVYLHSYLLNKQEFLTVNSSDEACHVPIEAKSVNERRNQPYVSYFIFS